jgi:hypothetical protein
MNKCWKCKEKRHYLEGVGISIAKFNKKKNINEWKWYTRYLCEYCLKEFSK